jgi:hypothetical protein
MPGRIFEDDPSITGNERLLRRIPRTWIAWDEFGNAAISSAAFKDEELSVNIESVMARDGRPLADAVRNYPGRLGCVHRRTRTLPPAGGGARPAAGGACAWRRLRAEEARRCRRQTPRRRRLGRGSDRFSDRLTVRQV